MKIALAIAAICTLVTTANVAAADWQLSGNWRLSVTCRDYTQVNTLSISEATSSRVLGTTNVDDSFGKVVGGAFDGKNFALKNTYKWEGRTYTEQWQGVLSKGGNYLRGKFVTNNKSGGGCSFKGPRL